MFPITRLSVVTFFSLALTSLAAPTTHLISRQVAGGSEETGWTNLPEVEGATIHRDWAMKGATLVRIRYS